MVILLSYWSSGSRDSSVAIQRSFLYTWCRRVTYLSWWLKQQTFQVVNLYFQRVVPRNLPLHPQSVLQAYLIKNTSRYGGRGSSHGQHFGVDAAIPFKQRRMRSQRICRVPSHSRIQIKRNLIFQVSLEVGPVSAPTQCQCVPGGGPSLVQSTKPGTRECVFLGYHDIQDIGSSRGVVWLDSPVQNQTGVIVGIITLDIPPSRVQPGVPIDLFGIEFAGHQYQQPPKQIVITAPISGREGENLPTRILTGLPANMT